MSTAEILAQLPKLSPQERSEIFVHLWRLEELAGPTPTEKALLDEAQADYDVNRSVGAAWSEVEARLRQMK